MNNLFNFYNFSKAFSTHYSIKMFGVSVFAYYYSKKRGWFRLFGRGISFKDIRIHGLIFSERIGKSKFFKINNWIISVL